jgi:predicted CxxxxCH...CXXCH cytochrome family protein
MTVGVRALWAAALSLAVLVLANCNEERDRSEPPAVFADVEPILEASCIECHSGPLAAASYRVEDYFTTIRCIPDPEGPAATLPADQTAPILAVLQQPSHAELLDAEDTSTLTTWVTDGAFPEASRTHPGQWIDPRAADWHGTYLRETDWQPIVDPERSDACGLCHAGSPAPVEEVTVYPPGATDCTDCHALPGGVMACGTCHGDGLRPYPPRDQCYFPGPPLGYAHEPHTTPSANMPRPLDCQACHFGEDYSMLGGSHANGQVDVVFQPAWGPDASYDPDPMRCATTCHARGGSTPVVAWKEELEIDCQSCHSTPPPGHANTACNRCHVGINPQGTRLTIEAPHINGRVDAF